jgi:hypothetical protein
MKKTQVVALLAFLFLALPLILWTNQVGPFDSQPSEPALLGTHFGMTLADVQNALKIKGLHLIDADTFKKEQPEVSANLNWYANLKPPQREENEKTEAWYLPPLAMFESYIYGRFNFISGKLASIDLQVNPYYLSNTRSLQQAQHIAEVITNYFKAQYQFIKNEPSKDIPGAYRVLMEGKYSELDLWVNLGNQPEPVIYIYLTYLPPNYE